MRYCPHGARDRLPERVDAAERFYAERAAVPRFQVCPDCPGGLDLLLSERGYRREAPVSLLTRVVPASDDPRPGPGMTAGIEPSPGAQWLSVLTAASEPGTDVEGQRRVLCRVQDAQAYVTVLAGGEPVGIGRAVADEGWTGVFTMATAPWARRRGVARLVLTAIADWADAHGAPRLYLQVERSNAPAHRLYVVAGFTRLATYHYRVRRERPEPRSVRRRSARGRAPAG